MSTLGWVSSPDGRGTIDIIWSCLVTITLCCWSSLCVNAPARGEGQIWQFWDKVNLACIGLLGPEFLFALASGQYMSARHSVEEFHSAGYPSWTMRHAFFADMGGFALKIPVEEPCPNLPPALRPRPMTFPLDARQLFYLVNKKYIEAPLIEEEDVAESDRLARFITIFQVVWFTINSIGRAVQHLQITTFELTTLAFIPCMIATSFCWYHKPSSIGPATVINCKTPLAEILRAAGDEASEPYRKTPLDFVSREEWTVSLLWAHDLNILRKLHFRIFARPMKIRPLNRIPNDNWPKPDLKLEAVMGVVALIYGAIFVAGWNCSFPTNVERRIWQASSIGTLVISIWAAVMEVFGFRICLPYIQNRKKVQASRQSAVENNLESSSASPKPRPHESWYGSPAIARKVRKTAARWRNNSPDRDPALEIPLRLLIPMTVLCATYSVFRLYFLLEDILGLRALPPSAFQTVAWPNWLPHI